MAKLSTSFEQLQWLDHSEPGSPCDYDDEDRNGDEEEDNDYCHDDDDDDEEEEEDTNDDDDEEEEEEENYDDYDDDDDDDHLHCVGCVSVCSFEDKVLAWNFILLILVAECAKL